MIADFIRVLRAADVRVSPSEAVDAAAVIDMIGLSERALLKHALGHSLAKTEEEKLAFATCFEHYFRLPESENISSAPPPEETDSIANGAAESQTMSQNISMSQMLENDDQAAFEAAMAQAAQQVGLSEARLFTQQGIFTRRIVEAMGLEELDQRISEARQNGDGDRQQNLEQGRAHLFDNVHDFVARQIAMRTKNAGRLLREDALSRIRLSNLDRSDMKIMRALIRRLAKRLASRHARRRKKARRGMLDVRRTLRANQRHNGLMFNLNWKRTKIERPHLIAMCDVSGSVAAVSRFFLMFLYSLDEVMPKTRSFVFSNRCGEISQYMPRHDMGSGDVDEVMEQALRQYGGGSTDYGQSFDDLAEAVLEKIDHRTTLMILGDARSNNSDPGHLILKEMHQRARRVIWLNPEPQSAWGSGDSEMRRLGAYCTQVNVCNSIRHVERVLDDLLRQSV